MNSPNIAHVALNRKGALELGQSPCNVCGCGYASYSINKSESCRDICEEFKEYLSMLIERSKNEQNQMSLL